jgi:PqqA peptide cyclase
LHELRALIGAAFAWPSTALHLHIAGGEPTARRDIVDLTRRAGHRPLHQSHRSGIGLSAKLYAERVEAA